MSSTTEIYYIHGPERRARIADAPKGRIARKYIPFKDLTEGEAMLEIIDERLQIGAAYYGDTNGLFQEGRNMIFRAKQAGIHYGLGAGYFGTLAPQLDWVANHIQRSRRLNKRTIRNLRYKSVSSIGMVDDIIDCSELEQMRANLIANGGVLANAQQLQIIEQELSKCKDREQFWESAINEYWGDSSYHNLYQYITPDQQAAFPTGSVGPSKVQNHRLVLSKLSSLSGISKSLLREIGDNGIMSRNANAIEPFGGNETIEALRNNPSINGITIATIAAIVTILSVVIPAAASFIKTVKEKHPSETFLQQQAFSFGLREYSAEEADFVRFSGDQTDNSGGDTTTPNGEESNSIIPFALLALGGAYLVTNK